MNNQVKGIISLTALLVLVASLYGEPPENKEEISYQNGKPVLVNSESGNNKNYLVRLAEEANSVNIKKQIIASHRVKAYWESVGKKKFESDRKRIATEAANYAVAGVIFNKSWLYLYPTNINSLDIVGALSVNNSGLPAMLTELAYKQP